MSARLVVVIGFLAVFVMGKMMSVRYDKGTLSEIADALGEEQP